ncbi:MAG: 4Fe-4S dicluster domain-containing protein [Chloroflexota bacterium]
MEATRRLINKQSLEALYGILSNEYRMYAPVANKKGTTEYIYDPPFADVSFNHIQSTLSVKNVVFPKVEKLFSYTTDKLTTEIEGTDYNKVPKVVLWGAHPCDTAAFEVLESIFCWDTKDEFFVRRKENILVVGLACQQSDAYCFCTSVGLSPESTRGSDILLTPLTSGEYFADFVTEKAQKILDQNANLFSQPDGQTKDITQIAQLFDHIAVHEKLKTAFIHPFWVENSLRCVGCSACAFVCPTCACFDMQDESNGKTGVRYRSWDSCGTALFTLHTSGHNPREVQSQRWRQRIMHKFSYMPDRNNSYGCVGCGRCSRGCPVDMNIAEQLLELQNI